MRTIFLIFLTLFEPAWCQLFAPLLSYQARDRLFGPINTTTQTECELACNCARGYADEDDCFELAYEIPQMNCIIYGFSGDHCVFFGDARPSTVCSRPVTEYHLDENVLNSITTTTKQPKFVYGYVFENSSCARVEVSNLTSSGWCPTTQYPYCDPLKLVESNNTLTCPYNRAVVSYQNASAIFKPTKSITCANGKATNSEGVTITRLMRPTCAFRSLCDECPIEEETVACPVGYVCSTTDINRYRDDDCSILNCTVGQLTVYDENKLEINMTTSRLYCTVLKRWYNNSISGSIVQGVRVNVSSVNCKSVPTTTTTTTSAPTTTTRFIFGYVFETSTCSKVEIFNQYSSAYCATTVYTHCNVSRLVESDNTITCPDKRAVLHYRNASAIWQTTKSISCVDGVFTNANGARITNLMRPTCGYRTLCDECPIEEETVACPVGFVCSTTDINRYSDDDCSILNCTVGQLTAYDENKLEINMTTARLYCTVLKKWYNYSISGSIEGVTMVNASSVNCKSVPTTTTTTTSAPTTTTRLIFGYVFETSTCSKVEIFNQYSSAYCATTVYTHCNVSRLVESDNTITCPDKRAILHYRNASANWQTTKSISCVNGVFTNANGARITNLMRPTCGYKTLCDECPPVAVETEACPEANACKTQYLEWGTKDDCSTLICRRGRLIAYDASKAEIITETRLWLLDCTVNKKWHNYSNDGSITGGVPIDAASVTCWMINCRGDTPPLIANASMIEDDYKQAVTQRLNNTAIIRSVDGTCPYITCAPGHTLFAANSSGVVNPRLLLDGRLNCIADQMWGDVETRFGSNMRIACIRDV